MTHTSARVWQWVGIILILCILGGAYWYFEVRAGYKTNVLSPTGSLTSGLIGYWPFDSVSVIGTTALDRSTNKYNGLISGGAVVTSGRVSQAVNFDGTDDSMALGSTGYLNVNATADMTISGWFSRDTFTTDDVIVSKINGIGPGEIGYGVYISSGDQLIFKIGDGVQTYTVTTSMTFTTSVWTHFSIVWDQDSAVNTKIYVNGQSVSTSTSGTISDIDDTSHTNTFRIGALSSGGELFDGKLDEIRVYNRTLTASEVLTLYNFDGTGVELNSGASQAQGGSRLDSGLAGYWAMDNGSGTSATDSSTNGNTGTLTNGPTWTTGQIGGAVDFDGTDDYIDLGTTKTYIDDGKPFTAAIWLNADVFSGVSRQAYTFKTNGLKGWVGFLDSGASYKDFSFGRDTSSSKRISFPGGFTTGVWRHVVIVYNGNGFNTTSNYTAYVDGASVVVNSSSALVSIENENYIGSYRSGGSRGYWDGKLDDLRFYNRQLSADEVAELYRLNTPSGTDTSLDGYWSFNGKDISGTTAYDRSGSGNSGTLTNGPTVTPGKVGQALNFDGTNDSVVLNTSTVLKPALFTVSTWAYADTGSVSYRGIYLPSYADGYNSGFLLYINNDGHAAVRYGNGSAPVGNITSGGSILGGWHYLATTFDGTTLTLFVDGVEKASTTASTLAYTGSSTTAQIGAGNGTDTFDGKLDEFRLYGRAFSEAEIVAQYTAGRSDELNSGASQAQGGSRLDSGLAGYWKLDDGSGTSATDSSTNGNTGTLTNGPTWTTGQIGGAVTLDGTDDYITVPDANSLDITNNLTLSVWIKPDTYTSNGDYRSIVTKGTYAWPEMNYYLSTYGAGATDQRANFSYYASGSTQEIRGNTNLGIGAWHHIMLTYNDTANEIKLYVDGVLENSTVTSGNPANNSLVAGSRALEIGLYNGNSKYFDGLFDEIRLYNRTLSTDEVAELYRLTSPTGTDTGLKGYWSFNGKDVSGTTAYDRSGAGNTGTLTSGPVVTPGKIGQALSFDGTDDYVVVNNTTTTYQFPNTTFTVAGWFKKTGPSNGYIVTQDACNGGWGVYLTSGITLYIKAAGSCGLTAASRTSSTTTLNDGAWHHFAVIVTTNTTTSVGNDISIYIDGALDQGSITRDGSTYGLVSTNLKIGTSDGLGGYHGGAIDEIRLYNRALTAGEISSLYNSGK